MTRRLHTLRRAWSVDMLSVQEYAYQSGNVDWRASALADDLPGEFRCIGVTGPTREAALFNLKAAIDAVREPTQVAA